MYLLDTNIVSEFRRSRPHGGVLAWLRAIDDTDLHIAAMTIGEIQIGIERARQADAGKAADIEAWLDRVMETYNVLPMDARIFRTWARWMHGRSDMLYEDAMIAATAHVHKLTVVTRNVADFAPFDVPIVNPFEF